MFETPKKIEADRNTFCRVTDYGIGRSLWVYTTKAHTQIDVRTPDYFKPILDHGPRRGDIVEITLGDDPAEATYVTAVFDNVNIHSGPITIGVIRRDKATPCRVKIEEAA